MVTDRQLPQPNAVTKLAHTNVKSLMPVPPKVPYLADRLVTLQMNPTPQSEARGTPRSTSMPSIRFDGATRPLVASARLVSEARLVWVEIIACWPGYRPRRHSRVLCSPAMQKPLQRRIRVKSAVLTSGLPLPVYPDQRTHQTGPVGPVRAIGADVERGAR